MRRIRPFFCLFPLVATAVACSVDGGDDVAASAAATTERYAPYPVAIRVMEKEETFAPQNAVLDFGDVIRNQGPIGSCASHGFLALVENQLFLQRGVAVDLAERYQLYANFLATGNMGNTPEVIGRYAQIVADLGALPEESYPYDAIAANAVNFEADAAQGLATNATAVTVDKAIEDTADATKKRSDVLTRPEYLGALPRGPYPVVIPVKARLSSTAKVPALTFEGKSAMCFSKDGAAAEPENRRLALTPREFAHYCLGITASPYFMCQPSLGESAARLGAGDLEPDPNDCAGTRGTLEKVARDHAEQKDRVLALTMGLVDRGQAVMLAVASPAQAMASAVWPDALPVGGGHAVLALGYVTAEELANPNEQDRGLLAATFDRIASKIEPAYEQQLAAFPTDKTRKRDLRVQSRLGKLAAAEGGLLFFRNSWGEKVGDVEIGAGGYQSMTFAYFAKSLVLVQSRRNDTIENVTWSGKEGECPTAIDIPPARAAFFSRPAKGKAEADALWAQAKPATCAP
jgi:hypothetical protein